VRVIRTGKGFQRDRFVDSFDRLNRKSLKALPGKHYSEPVSEMQACSAFQGNILFFWDCKKPFK